MHQPIASRRDCPQLLRPGPEESGPGPGPGPEAEAAPEILGVLLVETGFILKPAPEGVPPVIGLHLRPVVLGGAIGGAIDHQATDVVGFVVDALQEGAPPHLCKADYTSKF